MRVLVLGAGVVGVATAHQLAERGHSVEVVDQRSDVAMDTSASTGGLIAPATRTRGRPRPRPRCCCARWGVRPPPSGSGPARRRPCALGLRFLRECTPARARRNTLAKLALAQYSQQAMAELVTREGIEYRQTDGGILYLYRTARQLEHAAEQSALMRENGQQQTVLGRDEVANLEPALEHSTATFAGAVHDSGDSTGDPEWFTHELAERCSALGVSFRFGTNVKDIRADGDTDRAPQVGGIDEGTLVAWSRFGDEMRMSATAEFAGYDRRHTPPRLRGHPRGRRGPLPRRHRLVRSPLPHGAQADDPGRAAHPRCRPSRQPVLQHRSRPRRLDDGMRVGAGGQRPARGTASRPRPGALRTAALTRAVPAVPVGRGDQGLEQAAVVGHLRVPLHADAELP